MAVPPLPRGTDNGSARSLPPLPGSGPGLEELDAPTGIGAERRPGRAPAARAPARASTAGLLDPTQASRVLRAAVDGAVGRSAALQGAAARRSLAEAKARSASALLPGAPSFGAAYVTDQAVRNRNARDAELSVSTPIWLPGEATASGRAAAADLSRVDAEAARQRLDVAGQVREALAAVAVAEADQRAASARLRDARALEADVTQRVRGRDAAETELLVASADRIEAEQALSETTAALEAVRVDYRTLTGLEPTAAALNEQEPPATGARTSDPRLAEARRAVDLAQADRALAAIQDRDSPEVALVGRQTRDIGGTVYDYSVGVQLRIPFGTDTRNAPRRAAAELEAADAVAALARAEREFNRGESRARIELAGAEQTRELAVKRSAVFDRQRALFERSYAGGETSLADLIRARTLRVASPKCTGPGRNQRPASPQPPEPGAGFDAMRRPIMPLRTPAILLLGIVLFAPASAVAHGGDDGEAQAAAPAGSASARTEAASADLELVAVVSGRRDVTIYLDSYRTNEPVEGAAILVSENGGPEITAQPLPDGGYRLDAPWAGQRGRHDLTFTVTTADLTDLLAASLAIPSATDVVAKPTGGRLHEAVATSRPVLTPALTFLLGIMVTLAFRHRGRMRAALGGGAFLTALLLGGVAFAHGGADDGDGPPPVTGATDAPRRLPDGGVFVPKPAQRLLSIRTMVSATTQAAKSVQVIGQVIADPNASGRVQPSQPGRVEPGEHGLAYVGMKVAKGDVLAQVAPAIGSVDRGNVGSQVADIDQQVRLAEQKVTRLSGLAGSVAGKDIDEARAELAGARARRAAVAPTLAGKEVLRAPISGVVSVANAVGGQFVEGKDILFEIVDPSRMWVEALGFDPALSAQMERASAVTADGRPLAVTFVGRGMSLRQGAVPLEFSLSDPPPGLAVGSPVSVVVEVAGTRSGVALPRSAIVRMPNGGSAVWDHASAERFMPVPVRAEPLDGANVLVLAGLKPGQRIVTTGADLLNQVR